MQIVEIWKNSLSEAHQVLDEFINDPYQLQKCEEFTHLLLKTFQQGGKVFTCGNGGSHCDAMHFAEEWTGRYRKNRKALGALALGDPSHITCVANDFGFEYIFSRQLESLARPGDLLVGISTSGKSENIIKAFESAKQMGISKVALLGRDGGKLKSMAQLAIIVPAQTSDRIQEMHIKIIHTAIEAVERQLFPENYSKS